MYVFLVLQFIGMPGVILYAMIMGQWDLAIVDAVAFLLLLAVEWVLKNKK